MPSKLKLAFVGAGGIARSHLGGLVKLEDVELAGFCDVNKEAAGSAATEYGGRPFDDPDRMMDDVKPDAVFICLPPFAHGDAEMAAIRRKIPFFVEKPISNDLALSQKIASEAEKARLLTCAGYMNRYRRSINRVRELLRDDAAVIVHGGWIGRVPGNVKTGIGAWWIQKSKSGGQFVEQVTHTVDIVRYLCGEAREVYAMATKGFVKGVENYTIEDASHVVINLERGTIVNLYSSCAVSVGGGVSLTVHARNFTARFTGWEHSVAITKSELETENIKGEEGIFEIEDRAFLDAVKNGDASKVRSSYPDALKTLAITLAANESMEVGRPVNVKSKT